MERRNDSPTRHADRRTPRPDHRRAPAKNVTVTNWTATAPEQLEAGMMVRLPEWRDGRCGELLNVKQNTDGNWVLVIAWRFTGEPRSAVDVPAGATVMVRVPDPNRLRPTMPTGVMAVHRVQVRQGRSPEAM